MNPSNVSAQTINPTSPPAAPRQIEVRKLVLVLSLLLALTAWLFRDQVRSRILERGTLSNNSPTADLVEEMIQTSPHPNAAILAAWNTGRIVHRRVAIGEVKRIVVSSKRLPPELERLALVGAFDPDFSVREVALCILRSCRHAALEPLAAAQLRDCDPELRLLGLDYFKPMGAEIGVPTVAPLLDDSDPFVAIKGLKLLEKWTHQNFGVKLTEIAASVEGEKTGLRDLRVDGLSKAKEVIDRAKAWWAEHRSEFSSAPHSLDKPDTASANLTSSMAGDFELHAMDNRSVSLSDFRGKVVLVNFFTTSTPGCVSAMQDLMALQKKEGDHLAMLAVSLDNVPDPHGHVGHHHGEEHHNELSHEHERPSLSEVREKVARTVKESGANYPVLIDEDFRVGGRFNAGDVPSTLIIDGQGFIRRRFTGRRALPVLEMMVAEASRPAEAPPQREN